MTTEKNAATSNDLIESNDLHDSYEALSKISHCINKGCVICIEHCPEYSRNCAIWQEWNNPSCYNGDQNQLINELGKCCDTNPNDFVRLNVSDNRTYSKFILMVQSPISTKTSTTNTSTTNTNIVNKEQMTNHLEQSST